MKPEPEELKLKIELVPKTVWFSSLYQLYTRRGQPERWQRIKEELFRREGNRCWICGARGERLEAHEFWKYDDEKYVQTLIEIHHLCDKCHKIKHIGFWCHTKDGIEQLRKQGLTREDLIRHFCSVNDCSVQDFRMHEAEAFRIWRERSKHEWSQDLSNF